MSEILPKGWVITKLENCARILDGYRKPINSKERNKRIKGKDLNELFPYYGATGKVGYIDDYLIEGEYVLIGEDGAPFFDSLKNIAYLVNGKIWVNNHAHILQSLSDNSFLCHYLNQFNFTGFVTGTTRLKLTQGKLKEIPCCFPPLNEQKRIVAKLDAIIPRIDSLKARLDKIPALIKRFRQSVLTAAVTGKLTETWREGLGIDLTECLLDEIIIGKPRNGYSPKSVKYETKVKSLTLTATTSGKFDGSCFKYIDKEIPDDSHLWLEKNDILIQRSNSINYVGISAIYLGKNREFIYPDLMMKVQAKKDKVLPKFLLLSLQSQKTLDYFRTNATGTAGSMPKINQPLVMKAPVVLPALEEQKEIVRQVDNLFALSDKLETHYQNAKSSIDKLSQSVLAKAFRGELVLQDPNDEPAEKLLERIMAEKAKMESALKRGKKKGGGQKAKAGIRK